MENALKIIFLSFWLIALNSGCRHDKKIVQAKEYCEFVDDDADGVQNCIDRCASSTQGQVIGADGCEIPDDQGIKDTVPLFERGRSALTGDALAKIRNAANVILRINGGIQVIGHADNCGTTDEDQLLSEQRARVVAEELVRQGVDRSRIVKVEGRGHSQGLQRANSNCDQNLNDRVAIILFD